MGLDAGSATGQLELDVDGWKQGFTDAANAAKQSEATINDSMVSAGKEVDKLGSEFKDTAKESENLGKASVSLEDKLGSLLATAGTMATLKAGVSAIMGSMGDWAEAEASADRLRAALEFRGLEGSFGAFNELASKLQTLTGASDDTVKQLAAESIAQGKSVQQTMDTLSAAAAYSAVTGDELEASFEQFNKTLSGTSGRLGQTIPALKEFTEAELQNGAAIDYINAEYGAFTGQVGKTKISLDLMNQTVGDASESFGSAMAPVVLLVTDAITGLASIVANAGNIMKTVMAVGATVLMTALTGLAVRTAVVAAAKWGLFGAQMAVNAATAVGNPLLWAGIAAAAGLVVATTAVVASKVKEANASKKAAEATADHTAKVRTASEVVGKYSGQIDAFSIAQLKAARADLVAAQSRATYSSEIVAIGKKIAEIDTLLGEKNAEAFEASAAEQYKTAMESVAKTLEATLTDEQKLAAEIAAVSKIRGATAKEEEDRLKALGVMNNRLAEIRTENAEKEQKEYRETRDAYNSNMKDVFALIDDRKVRERELLNEIEKIESFKGETQEDEAARLEALQELYTDLGQVQKEIDGVSMWQQAQDAMDDYVASMKKGHVTLKNLAKLVASATGAIYAGAQDIVSQYFTNELATTENTYSAEQEALEAKQAEETAAFDTRYAAALLALQTDYENKLITEEEYNAQKAALDEEKAAAETTLQDEHSAELAALEEEAAEKKNAIAEKQFKAEKIVKVANIWMSAAESIAGWWESASSLGPIAGPIFAGVMTGATMTMATAQTGLVAEQEYVPSYASGGTHDGGYARVNEEGGEIMNLPDGTVIVPRDLSEQVAAGAGEIQRQEINVSFAGATITKDVNLDLLAQKVSREIARKVRR